MRILLTNDDGILSPGIQALHEVFSTRHDVWIVAPDGERSGCSSSITISEPIRCSPAGDQRYAVSGTPADCVILATLGAIPVVPEVVLSGINIGPNLGTDIIYSGTCAAARQAVYKGIPGIAVSINSFHSPFHFEPVASFLLERLDELLDLWTPDHFLNVNAPNLPQFSGVEVTTPSTRRYEDRLLPFEPPRGGAYYFVDGRPADDPLEPGTDWYAVEHRRVSLSPIELSPVNHAAEAHYRAGAFVTG